MGYARTVLVALFSALDFQRDFFILKNSWPVFWLMRRPAWCAEVALALHLGPLLAMAPAMLPDASPLRRQDGFALGANRKRLLRRSWRATWTRCKRRKVFPPRSWREPARKLWAGDPPPRDVDIRQSK